MQFVPPYPAMGQGRQYQSQGAAQAPTISQTTTWSKAWVEVKVEDMDHRPGLQGPKGVSTPSHHRMSLHISRSFRVHFYFFAYG